MCVGDMMEFVSVIGTGYDAPVGREPKSVQSPMYECRGFVKVACLVSRTIKCGLEHVCLSEQFVRSEVLPRRQARH